MSTSNVGSSGVYEAGDQRNYKNEDEPGRDRYEEGKKKSHNKDDPKDERSIANRLEAESKRDDESKKETFEEKLSKDDATKPAKMHGNEPSKGAKIDQEIAEEEAEMMKKKGEFGPKSGNK